MKYSNLGSLHSTSSPRPYVSPEENERHMAVGTRLAYTNFLAYINRRQKKSFATEESILVPRASYRHTLTFLRQPYLKEKAPWGRGCVERSLKKSYQQVRQSSSLQQIFL